MMDQLQNKIRNDGRLGSIRSKIQNGDYSEAAGYGIRCGELLSEVIRDNMTEELFQECGVDDLASLLLPVIEQNFNMISNAATASQRSQNQEIGIGIKPIRSEFNSSQYYNIFAKSKGYESFEQAAWLFDEPIAQDSLKAVDDAMRENAEFQYEAGLKTCVIRETEPDCCDFCAGRAGTYYFPNVPDTVWERHNYCRCEIRIETEKDTSGIRNRFIGDENGIRRMLLSESRENTQSIMRLQYEQRGDNIGTALRKKAAQQKTIEIDIRSGNEKTIIYTIADNHNGLGGRTPGEWKQIFEESGFQTKPLKKGTFKGMKFEDGGGYRVVLEYDGGYFQYHPKGGKQHEGAYYKISSGKTDTIRYNLDGSIKYD